MIKKTLKNIESALAFFDKPTILCSFGKDSTALLHLVHSVNRDIPIIFWHDPFMQDKHIFAYSQIQKMKLTVYDYPPSGMDFCYNNGEMDVIYRQDTGGVGIFWLRGLTESDKGLCLFRDFMERPTVSSYSYKWDLTFSGHKNSDNDKMLGDIRVSNFLKPIGNTVLCHPLMDWSDEDIWGYIHKNNIPYNKERYDNKDNKYNNDYYECCYACVKPDGDDSVFCHKENKEITNRGKVIDYKYKVNTLRTLTGV